MVMLRLTEETCHWLATAAQNGPKWPLPQKPDYWTTQESPQLTLPGPNFVYQPDFLIAILEVPTGLLNF